MKPSAAAHISPSPGHNLALSERRTPRPAPCTIPIRVDPATGQFMRDPTTGMPIYERFLMTKKQVMGYLGLSSTTVDRLIATGLLSKPLKINDFTARWYSDEVAALVERSRRRA